MKWANHRLVTGVLVYAGTGNVLYALYSLVGSTLPDRLEGRPPKEKKAYWQWRSKHRQNTHWLLPYMSLFGALMFVKDNILLSWIEKEAIMIPIFIVVGAILHILEDGICGKVPILTRKKKYGIKLFKVGSSWEYFISYSICLTALYYRFMV